MLLANAHVLTMDATAPHATRLAIANGRIIDPAQIPSGGELLDLDGLTVVPGFVESHCHFRGWALARHRLDAHDCDTLDALLDAIRAHDPAQPYVLGGGWADTIITHASPDLLLADVLDIAAGGRPIALHSRDGHALLTTPRTLTKLGLTLDDLEVPGGVVERDASGTFTGVLREESDWIVRRALPEDDLTTRVMADAMSLAAARGVTSIHDMDGAAALRTWQATAAAAGTLDQRVWVHALATDIDDLADLRREPATDMLQLGGLKLFADGTLGSGTALLHAPEHTSDGEQPRAGIAVTSGDALREFARRAGEHAMPLLVHAIGDRACSDVLDALADTKPHWDRLAMRPRIEHAQLMRASDITRAARLGIALSVQPAMLVSDRDTADARWGDRTASAFAFRSMVDAGCQLLFGSDAPIEALNPLAAMHAAITRDGGAHDLPPARGGWHPEQALDPQAALLATTATPADVTGVGTRIGRLTPGRAADLVVLSGDPRREPIAEIEIVATMVAGHWTHGESAI